MQPKHRNLTKGEAAVLWRRIHRDDEELDLLNALCRQLALAMLRNDEIVSAVRQEIQALPFTESPGVEQAVSRIRSRAQCTSIQDLVSRDLGVAEFLVCHPDVVSDLRGGPPIAARWRMQLRIAIAAAGAIAIGAFATFSVFNRRQPAIVHSLQISNVEPLIYLSTTRGGTESVPTFGPQDELFLYIDVEAKAHAFVISIVGNATITAISSQVRSITPTTRFLGPFVLHGEDATETLAVLSSLSIDSTTEFVELVDALARDLTLPLPTHADLVEFVQRRLQAQHSLDVDIATFNKR